jgi:hypothetical protein
MAAGGNEGGMNRGTVRGLRTVRSSTCSLHTLKACSRRMWPNSCAVVWLQRGMQTASQGASVAPLAGKLAAARPSRPLALPQAGQPYHQAAAADPWGG